MNEVFIFILIIVTYIIGMWLAYGRSNAQDDDGDLWGMSFMKNLFCMLLSWIYFIPSSIMYIINRDWQQKIKYLDWS